MDKKYTIFVSSTQLDLRDERDAVAKAILELGHIPVGMEMFSAADEQQWQMIQRQIQQCDYYVVILAHRYGSLAGEVSYTEREYDYAAELGIPTLGFVLKEDASWPADRVDRHADTVSRLKKFKEKVQSKMVSYWNNADHLNTKVTTALSKQFNLSPRPGWVRATEVPGPEAFSELARLSKENEMLRQSAMKSSGPEFEIMAAYLMSVADGNSRVRMIVLVHYEGSPIYIPQHRCVLIFKRPSGLWRLAQSIAATSRLIEQQGDDLQINGSGYFDIISVDTLPGSELGDVAHIQLEIQIKSGVTVMLTAPVEAPEWRYGEPGIDLTKI